MMKAVRIRGFGEMPTLDDVPTPAIADDRLLVRVEAAALNPLDALVASGAARRFFTLVPPLTLGTDLAGVVEAVGGAVTGWTVGDRVIAWLDAGTGGALAERAAVPADACVPLPARLSAAEGAAIPTAGITAWHALFSTARLKAGETVLIHAAAGGVGCFSVQFAHLAGAHVIATASGDGLALARRLGADRVIDHKAQDFADGLTGIDVVLDLVGGDIQARSWPVLRPGGRLVSTVMPPDEAQAGAYGVQAAMFYAKSHADGLGDLVSEIARQGVAVVIDRQLPLDRFAEAWAHQTGGRARGKIVVTP